jgi:hypothetical protein
VLVRAWGLVRVQVWRPLSARVRVWAQVVAQAQQRRRDATALLAALRAWRRAEPSARKP